MEGESPQMTDTAKGTTLIERVDGMCRVLDDEEVMLLSQRHDGVHVTGDTRIMYHNDNLRTLVEEGTDGVHGDIGIRGATVGKHHLGTFTEEGDGRRHKGIGGYDHLVTRL